MIKIYERVSIKTLYLHQLNLYRLITESPPPPKKKKKNERKKIRHKQKHQREMQPCYICKCTLEGDLEVEVD